MAVKRRHAGCTARSPRGAPEAAVPRPRAMVTSRRTAVIPAPSSPWFRTIILSAIVLFVVSTLVVLPLTVKLPSIIIDGALIVY
jgi:hypothetical protein